MKFTLTEIRDAMKAANVDPDAFNDVVSALFDKEIQKDKLKIIIDMELLKN